MKPLQNNIKDAKYSVLMSIYAKEKPEYFETALKSLYGQTIQPDEIVIVCDGPLTPELDAVIENAKSNYPGLFQIVRLEENKGLGNALMVGLPLCRNELVMRADSDDISLPNRAEVELDTIINGGWDICSGTISIFFDDPNVIEGERKLPSEHEDIVKFAKTRSPLNHSSTMMKKSKALEAGNYQSLLYREDYYLWIRMILNGVRFHNIDEPLMLVRMDKNTYRRRKNKDSYKSQKKLSKFMKEKKFISFFEYLKISFIYWVQYVSPPGLNEWMYKHVLQKKGRN